MSATEKVGFPDIHPAQVRAARALLDWSRDDLARVSGVTVRTLDRLESGDVLPQRRTLDAVVGALQTAGVQFIEQNGGGPGVRLRNTLNDT